MEEVEREVGVLFSLKLKAVQLSIYKICTTKTFY